MQSLADKAYHAIRGLIVSLELAPGALIDERELIERLGIGRTPVREALRRLAQEQLVEVYPRRGMFVTPVDARARRGSPRCEQCSSPRRRGSRPSGRPTPTARSSRSCSSELDAGGSELIDLDERIHRAVYRAAHNDLLEATLEQYYMLALRIWSIGLDRAHELEEAVGSIARCSRRSTKATATVRRRRCARTSRTSSRRCIACS